MAHEDQASMRGLRGLEIQELEGRNERQAMERRKEEEIMSKCRHARKTAIGPGFSWCLRCGAYRVTKLVARRDGWRSIWGRWNKPTGA